MRTIYLMAISLLCIQASAQMDTMSTNYISALVNPNGLLFHDPSIGVGGFEVPKGSYRHTIYQSGLWFVNLNPDSSINLAIQQYANQDYVPGPVSNNYTASYDSTYNRVWRVSRALVDSHIVKYQQGSYVTPEVITNWPAHGDTTRGEAFYLAPFFDNNSNGIYDPSNGDTPDILGDQAVYFITNSDRNPPSVGQVLQFPLEIHGMVYGFECDVDSAIANTAFVRYNVYNRSSTAFSRTTASLWVDFDLGNSIDDFMECDVDRSAFFVLNGDSVDESGAINNGYGTHIPSQGVMILRGPYQDIDGQDNSIGIGVGQSPNGYQYGDGIVDNECLGLRSFISNQTGTWTGATSYYRTMKGVQLDGSPWKHWGTDTITTFQYPGTSDSQYYGTGGLVVPSWTESLEGNPPSDRRGVGSMGEFSIQPGEVNTIDLAFVFGRDAGNPGVGNAVANMKQRMDAIRTYYDNNTAPCGTITSVVEKVRPAVNMNMYPNPVSDQLNIDVDGMDGAEGRIFNAQGQVIKTFNVNRGGAMINLSDVANGIYIVQLVDSRSHVAGRVLIAHH